MIDVLLALTAPPAPDAPTFPDKLEAWSTLGGAVVALVAAAATIWLLVHTIGEARAARKDAANERAEATTDRELARQDRELAAAERRDGEKAQARMVVWGFVDLSPKRAASNRLLLRIHAEIANYSPGPILDLNVLLLGQRHGERPLRHLIGEETVLGPGDRFPVDVIAPESVLLGDSGAPFSAIEVEVRFTDMAGRRWTRRPGEQPLQDLVDEDPRDPLDEAAHLTGFSSWDDLMRHHDNERAPAARIQLPLRPSIPPR